MVLSSKVILNLRRFLKSLVSKHGEQFPYIRAPPSLLKTLSADRQACLPLPDDRREQAGLTTRGAQLFHVITLPCAFERKMIT